MQWESAIHDQPWPGMFRLNKLAHFGLEWLISGLPESTNACPATTTIAKCSFLQWRKKTLWLWQKSACNESWEWLAHCRWEGTPRINRGRAHGKPMTPRLSHSQADHVDERLFLPCHWVAANANIMKQNLHKHCFIATRGLDPHVVTLETNYLFRNKSIFTIAAFIIWCNQHKNINFLSSRNLPSRFYWYIIFSPKLILTAHLRTIILHPIFYALQIYRYGLEIRAGKMWLLVWPDNGKSLYIKW